METACPLGSRPLPRLFCCMPPDAPAGSRRKAAEHPCLRPPPGYGCVTCDDPQMAYGAFRTNRRDVLAGPTVTRIAQSVMVTVPRAPATERPVSAFSAFFAVGSRRAMRPFSCLPRKRQG